MAMRAGIKIDAETLGEGDLAEKGDRVPFACEFALTVTS